MNRLIKVRVDVMVNSI